MSGSLLIVVSKSLFAYTDCIPMVSGSLLIVVFKSLFAYAVCIPMVSGSLPVPAPLTRMGRAVICNGKFAD